MDLHAITKACARCKRTHPLIEFSPAKKYKYGRHSVCKDCKSKEGRVKRNADPHVFRERDRRSYALHAEEVKARKQAYRAQYPDKIRETKRRYRLANLGKVTAYNRAYFRANLDRYIAHRNLRRARELNATIGTVDRNAVLARDGWICHICGGLVLRHELNFDHIIPLTRGGAHSNDNLAVAHASCNFSKHNRLDVVSMAPPRIRRKQ